MKFAAIYSALMAHYEAGNFGLDIQVPNKEGTPVGNSKWAKIDYIIGEMTNATTGPDGFELQEGFFQVTLFYPNNTGIGDILEKADAIAKHFRAGIPRLVYGGQDVIMRGAKGSNPRNDGNAVTCTVSAYFAAYVRREP